MRNRLQQVLLSTYLRNHNTYPILVLLFASRRGRSSQGTHTLIKLLNYDDLSYCCLCTRSRSQVVHNRGHGFSKRFNPAGVYQLPITRLRTRAHLSQSGPLKALIEALSREIRNDIIPLTNNEQIRVAPGESTSVSRAGRSLDLV